ncbi:MAG: CDP-glycerol glycerophosphotransferase family protein [Clostridia bacterium]|nr:CDP-glycerol glycerophosphotransferase family protein [Clostridia bacterium]
MKTVKNFIKSMVYFFSKKCIVFESCPDMGDNSKAVFDEMIRRKLNKKYKLVWLIFDDNVDYPKIYNVEYVKKETKKYRKTILTAKCFICSNRFVYSDVAKQKSFFLTHGMYVKNPKEYYKVPDEIDYCLSASEGLKEIQANAISAPIEKMFALGYPRNDVLTETKMDLSKFFGNYNKYIVWYPTFRQHNSGMGTGSKHAFPIVWNKEYATKLNDYAKKTDTLIVLKPHFAQDVSKIKNWELDNLRIISDSFFIENNITSYQFVASCDALLTDYSSIYFDYTLCDKPIGLIWEDYEDYEKNPGFAFDMKYYMQGGEKIYSVEELCSFIQNVADGVDVLQEDRRKIRDVANFSIDGKSAMRVTDFIIKKAKL